MNGEKLNNNDYWSSPAEMEKNIIKRERKKLLLFVFSSNLALFLIFNLKGNEEITQEVVESVKEKHSIIQIKANLHIPLENHKTKVSLFTQRGKLLTQGYLLSKTKQSPLTEVGPWKMELPHSDLSKVISYENKTLKIVPYKTREYQRKEHVNEIIF